MFKRGEELINPHMLRKRTKSENKLKDNKPRENSNSIRNTNLSPVNRNSFEYDKGQETIDASKKLIKSDSKHGSNLRKLFSSDIESPPRLIIDVNIKPGEKKKIVVYNGDTSQKLAENFAIENSKFFKEIYSFLIL